jgi:hypothetical protein
MAGMVSPLTLLEARMQFTTLTARHLLTLTAAVAIAACSDDGGLTSPDQKLIANSGTGTQSSPSDTTAGSPNGEWHLATIRGVLRGVTSASGLAAGDSSSATTSIIAGAKIDIHKYSLDISGTTGDSASMQLKDLGVVATVTTDAQGKFQHVLADPIIVKSGQPSPKITYRLTVTPPAGSPFAAQSGIQVFFMEQFPAGTPDLNYYLYPPKK